jgi:acetate kinase
LFRRQQVMCLDTAHHQIIPRRAQTHPSERSITEM